MKKVFYLNTCDTCRKILAQFDLSGWELREIKKEPVTNEELTEMYKNTKSYEALFSKKSTQIKQRGLDVKALTENDFKDLLLDHYTFLKRPVFLTDDQIFVGNDKKNVEALQEFFRKKL
ncbi:arsenate reductase family protein [Chryseobacterium profundimaris]|uniref:Arsenate reductase, glutaredoxin family n=1 Tax=Chryseobacterium profundimaris TaxID=1387275 RepID=A0ABY1PKN5_9FLAO|nr:ArsC/Spx/MgsR family protein [Chryseobacterium profundimaris]SMP36304.1 Arsenate reductase, glutaredoxin family [Chryseobacterium profundimaris]